MASQIDALLTSEEREVLSAYADPKKYGIGRAVRLSVQYALGTGVFVLLCLQEDEPLWALAVYAIFLIFMAVRLVAPAGSPALCPQLSPNTKPGSQNWK